MPTLLPLPYYHRLPSGPVEHLPATREGVRSLCPQPFVIESGPALPEIIVTTPERHRPVRGICGLLPASCFSDGTIRPHENTLTSRLERQEKLVLEDRAALGKPVLLTVPSLGALWQRLPPPSAATVQYRNGEGLTYRLCTGGPAPKEIDLSEYGPLVIADGHHRAYTHAMLAARGLPAFAQLPVVIVGADELTISSFMRVIETALPPKELLMQLADHFSITSLPHPAPPTQCGEWLLSYRGCHYRLQRNDATGLTDPGWLIESVLPDIFGITDVRSDPRIQSVPPPLEGETLCLPEATHDRVILLGYPVSYGQFFGEVTAGRVFPPKSTRFTPRIPSGLLVWMP